MIYHYSQKKVRDEQPFVLEKWNKRLNYTKKKVGNAPIEFSNEFETM